ncbi:hypothetical protein [Streptomyces anulatus]|uniref:hypothetical protein n=1 Tax=Streptomyces anulatus TaxID=1892 RepID=UPI0037144198
MSAIPVPLAVLLSLAGVTHLQLGGKERRLLASAAADHPGEMYDPLRTRRIATAQARAGITDSIPMMLSTMATAVLLLSTATLAGRSSQVPHREVAPELGCRSPWGS